MDYFSGEYVQAITPTLTRKRLTQLLPHLPHQSVARTTVPIDIPQQLLARAQDEILRAQRIVDEVEKGKKDAEEAAARARARARKLEEESVVRQAMEQGRREGYRQGLRQGQQLALERLSTRPRNEAYEDEEDEEDEYDETPTSADSKSDRSLSSAPKRNGFIPVLGSDSMINLPAPYELSQTPKTMAASIKDGKEDTENSDKDGGTSVPAGRMRSGSRSTVRTTQEQRSDVNLTQRQPTPIYAVPRPATTMSSASISQFDILSPPNSADKERFPINGPSGQISVEPPSHSPSGHSQDGDEIDIDPVLLTPDNASHHALPPSYDAHNNRDAASHNSPVILLPSDELPPGFVVTSTTPKSGQQALPPSNNTYDKMKIYADAEPHTRPSTSATTLTGGTQHKSEDSLGKNGLLASPASLSRPFSIFSDGS
ncbi:hypothetical protein PLEOSDRAFT_1086692 [Pleurotus ostreatus PC15]|uniref:Uncharacterized protein n=1 Tax=Pleurotus ostreatus (strain PC15) TaxID=1137138 RepID=A0A067NGY7_PLEO1|nr:hypothetical protein PLEOSDRAFT_1086692 [Pleurotus ostreatus PC15]